MPIKAIRLAELLEDLYGTIDAPDAEWQRRVLARVLPGIDQGAGVCGYHADASSAGGFEVSGFMPLGGDEAAMRAGFERWAAVMPPAFKRSIHLFAPVGTGSTLPQPDFAPADVSASGDSHGFPDMLGINGLDATGRGYVVAAASATPIPLPEPRTRALWARVAVHMATAARVRRRLGERAATEMGEAVLTPDGRTVHAVGVARHELARSALRAAAQRIDRARTRQTRYDAEAVTEMWQALVARRWSLVDVFEAGGRRYVVAIPNRPEARARPALTTRESEIAGAVAVGHPNKVIAYELGISESTVATHVARISEKLGAANRIELIRALGELALTRGRGPA